MPGFYDGAIRGYVSCHLGKANTEECSTICQSEFYLETNVGSFGLKVAVSRRVTQWGCFFYTSSYSGRMDPVPLT